MLCLASCSASSSAIQNALPPLSIVLLSQAGVLFICVLFQAAKQVLTLNNVAPGFSKEKDKESGDATNKPGEASNATRFKSVSMGNSSLKKRAMKS